MLEGMKAEIRMDRLETIARRLGSQDIDACPTDWHVCFRNRQTLTPYLEDTVDSECAECWLQFILRGE